MPTCCVVGCNNTSEKCPEKKFHSFPNKRYEQERKKKWIVAVNRKNPDGTLWQPYTGARVCSDHFVGGKASNIEKHPGYVPSLFPDFYKKRKVNESSSIARFHRAKQRKTGENIRPVSPLQDDTLERHGEPKSTSVSTQVNFDYCRATFEFVATREEGGVGTSCNIGYEVIQAKKDAACGTENDLKACKGFHGFESVKESEELIKYLTSTSLSTWLFLLSLLPKNAYRSMLDADALLLFLMKMNLGLSFSCLGVFFNVHRTTAMRIFLTTLETLSIKTADFIFWPSKLSVKEMLPDAFKGEYSNTRVIIDCTEIRTEMPTIDERVYMYSHYKSGYTFKFLIGVTPNGLISFKSNCYGGRCSDAQIANDSGFLGLIEKGDVVLADKGFPGVKTTDSDTIIVMPPFLHDGKHTADEVARTQSVVGVRIHVERSIQRVKIFEILRFIPCELFKHVDNIVHMACILANFMPPIIKDE